MVQVSWIKLFSAPPEIDTEAPTASNLGILGNCIRAADAKSSLQMNGCRFLSIVKLRNLEHIAYVRKLNAKGWRRRHDTHRPRRPWSLELGFQKVYEPSLAEPETLN